MVLQRLLIYQYFNIISKDIIIKKLFQPKLCFVRLIKSISQKQINQQFKNIFKENNK